jgi:hypothetical protein
MDLWTEIKETFSWWMIPAGVLVVVLVIFALVSLTPDDLIPREYEVH